MRDHVRCQVRTYVQSTTHGFWSLPRRVASAQNAHSGAPTQARSQAQNNERRAVDLARTTGQVQGPLDPTPLDGLFVSGGCRARRHRGVNPPAARPSQAGGPLRRHGQPSRYRRWLRPRAARTRRHTTCRVRGALEAAPRPATSPPTIGQGEREFVRRGGQVERAAVEPALVTDLVEVAANRSDPVHVREYRAVLRMPEAEPNVYRAERQIGR